MHGLYYTSRSATATSTSPRCRWCWPLAALRLGGYRSALLLPDARAVAAAFAARAIARRRGPEGADGLAFWVIGLASPLAIYALDSGSTASAWRSWPGARWRSYDAVHDRPTWWRGWLAGVAFGAAFSMRTEALVYGFAMVGVACLVLLVARRDLAGAVLTGATAVVGLAAALPRQRRARDRRARQHASGRAGRAERPARAAPRSRLRVQGGGGDSLSPVPSVDAESFLLGLGLALALGYLVWCSWKRRERTLSIVVAGLVGFIYLTASAPGSASSRASWPPRRWPSPAWCSGGADQGQAVPGLRPGAAAAGVLLPVPRRSGAAVGRPLHPHHRHDPGRGRSRACPGSSSGYDGSCSRSPWR